MNLVCPTPLAFDAPHFYCPHVAGGTQVTVLAKGLPRVVWGIDETVVEVAVHIPGQPPLVRWTTANFLRP